MKALPLAVILCFLCTVLNAQVPSIAWQKSLGGSNQEYGYCIRPTNDGGFVVVGESVSPVGGMITNNYGGYDCWVVKLDTSGAVEWQKGLGGSDYDRASQVQQTADGGFIVVGFTYSNNFDITGHYGSSDVWVVKLSSSGALEWQKALGGSSVDAGESIRQTTDGGYILCGYTFSNNGAVTTGPGGWIVKISSTGAIQWQRSIGSYWNGIQQTTDGGYIAAGYSNGPLGNTDYHVVKLNATGATQWAQYYGGTSSDAAYAIEQTTDGGYIITGESDSSNTQVTNNNGSFDYWVVKINSTGTIEWQKALGGSSFDYGKSVQQTADGGYIVCGITTSNNGLVSGNHGDQDYWIVKLNSEGNLTWQKTLGGVGTDWGQSIRQTTDGGFIVAGTTGSWDGDVSINYGDRDYWVVKLNPENLSTGDFANNPRFTLFPNPTKTDFEVSDDQNLQALEVYDLSGRRLLVKNDFTDKTISLQKEAKGLYTVKMYGKNGAVTTEKIIKE